MVAFCYFLRQNQPLKDANALFQRANGTGLRSAALGIWIVFAAALAAAIGHGQRLCHCTIDW